MANELEGVERWLAAVRWRRRVERELRALGLTLTQWIVLDAAAALVREHRDAVSQVDIGRRAQLDKATMSDVMMRLSLRGLVDRDIDATGLGYRIYVTDEGDSALEEGRARIRCLEQVLRSDGSMGHAGPSSR